MNHTLFDHLRARIQPAIQTRLWGMDIHPTAKVANSALIDRTWPKGVHIGPNCSIGEEAVILTHDFTLGLYLDTQSGREPTWAHAQSSCRASSSARTARSCPAFS